VQSALNAHKVVVLLFWNPKGADDQSVKQALGSVSKHNGDVAVFSDTSRNFSRYVKITAQTNLTRTPTLVVVNRQGNAQVATGYLDRDSVEQYVVDAFHGG
jgi:hypothetical protein